MALVPCHNAIRIIVLRASALLACVAALLGLLGLVNCGTRDRTVHDRAISFVEYRPTRRAGTGAIAVFMAESSHTRQAWETLRDELESNFDVFGHVIAGENASDVVEREIATIQPDSVVLMGNLPMNAYLEYQARRGTRPVVPAVVVMASFFDEQRPLFRNATGILYEIPAISTFVSLRSFVHGRLQRVGVPHRPLFAGYVEKQRQLARVEQVDLVPLQISGEPGPYEIREALDYFTSRERVDALWVLNDNVLLDPELIAKGWLYMLRRKPMLVVVGVSSLVDTRLHFGSFAMLPDHAGLGVQTANLIFKLAKENWDASAQAVELPISVQTVVDLPWTLSHTEIREDALERIDKILR